MATVHEDQRRYAISKVPQTDYDTATDTAVPANFVQLVAMDKNMAKHSVATGDNKGEANGYEQATEEWALTHDTDRSLDVGVSSEQIGRLLLLQFGSVTTTQPDAVTAPTVYQHVFKPQDRNVSRQLPAATLIEIIGSVLNRKFPSMAAGTLSIKGDAMNRISASMGLRGSGAVVMPSGMTNAQWETIALANQHYLFNSQAKLTIADAGTLLNTIDYGSVKRLESWEFAGNNNPIADDAFRPGANKFQDANDPTSGALRSEMLFGTRDWTMNFMARLLSQSDELAALRSRKKLDALIELVGARIGVTTFNHKLSIHAPKVSYTTVDLGAKNGLITVQITPRIFFDTATNQDATVTLINETPSYLL